MLYLNLIVCNMMIIVCTLNYRIRCFYFMTGESVSKDESGSRKNSLTSIR